MKLTAIEFKSIPMGDFVGFMAFFPTFSPQPGSPSDAARETLSHVSSLFPQPGPTRILLYIFTSDGDDLFSYLKSLHILNNGRNNIFTIIESTMPRLAPHDHLANHIIRSSTAGDFIGLPASEFHLILKKVPQGRFEDPTAFLNPIYYPSCWVDKGDATPLELVRFILDNPKYRILSPTRDRFSQRLKESTENDGGEK